MFHARVIQMRNFCLGSNKCRTVTTTWPIIQWHCKEKRKARDDKQQMCFGNLVYKHNIESNTVHYPTIHDHVGALIIWTNWIRMSTWLVNLHLYWIHPPHLLVRSFSFAWCRSKTSSSVGREKIVFYMFNTFPNHIPATSKPSTMIQSLNSLSLLDLKP